MIVDFRRQWRTHRAIQIHDKTVEIVIPHNYLGAIFQDILKCDLNIEAITKKEHQRLPLLQKLRSFILKLFYYSFTESVWTFSFGIRWFYNLNAKQRKSLQRIVKVCSKIICDQVRTLSFLCVHRILRSEICFKGPWACPGASVQITGTQNQQSKKLFCSTAVPLLNRAWSYRHQNCVVLLG